MTTTPQPHPRLFNEDLAPAPERKWGTYSIFALWMSDTHAISNYAFAASLFVLGLPAWEVFLSLLVGISLVHWLMNRMGHAGHRTGVPYPVLARASWGVYGANIPALLRAVMAVAWYGIQTWLASTAVVLLTLQIAPGLDAYHHNSVLGLSTLGWIAFMVMWGLQAVLLTRGMEFIRKVQDFATGPVVWLVVLALAVYLVVKAGGDISLTRSLTGLSGAEQGRQSLIAVSLTVATFLTLVLNYADFARFTPDHRSYRRGNLIGLPVNFTAFAVVAVLVTAGTHLRLRGGDLRPGEGDPEDRQPGGHRHRRAGLHHRHHRHQRRRQLRLARVRLREPGAEVPGLQARRHDHGGARHPRDALEAVLLRAGDPVLPGRAGRLPRPAGGDPARRLLPDPPRPDRRGRALLRRQEGKYYYRRGYNPKAVVAFLPAAVVSAGLALIPAFDGVAPFSWVFGMGLAGALYVLVSRRDRVGVGLRSGAGGDHPVAGQGRLPARMC